MTRRTFLAAQRRLGAGARQGGGSGAGPHRPAAAEARIRSRRRAVRPEELQADVAAPLVLMFHGAGGTGLGVSYTFTHADDLGVIVLAPDSRDEATWDFLVHGYGEDVAVHRHGAEGHLRALQRRPQADGDRRALRRRLVRAVARPRHRRHLRPDHGVLSRRDAAGRGARQAEDLHLARPERSDHADRRHQPEVRAAAQGAGLRRDLP